MSFSYYISKTRFKIAFVFIASIAIIWINAFLMGHTLIDVLKNYGIMSLYLLTAGFFLWFPALQYQRKSAYDIWNRWGEWKNFRTREEFEDVRFNRVFEDKKYAVMKDQKEAQRVTTTLMYCSCKDFRNEKRPCRHMSKLADILDVYEAEYYNWDTGEPGERLH